MGWPLLAGEVALIVGVIVAYKLGGEAAAIAFCAGAGTAIVVATLIARYLFRGTGGDAG